MAIAGYIGKGRHFDEATAEFAVTYADQTARDHQMLVAAIAAVTIAARLG
jgi:hypothetical protein